MAIKLPTVSCVPVAIRVVPRESETMMEFGEKEEELVPPFAIGRIPVTPVVSETCPPRFESERQTDEIE